MSESSFGLSLPANQGVTTPSLEGLREVWHETHRRPHPNTLLTRNSRLLFLVEGEGVHSTIGFILLS